MSLSKGEQERIANGGDIVAAARGVGPTARGDEPLVEDSFLGPRRLEQFGRSVPVDVRETDTDHNP